VTEIRNDDHERWQEDAAAYALGALDESEARAFEEHLAQCPRCRDELAALREAVGALPGAAPDVAPPPELKQRVMATVRAEAPLRARSHDAAEPAGPPAKPERSRPWPWRRTPRVAIAAAAALAIVVAVVAVTLSVGSGATTRTYAGVVHAPGATASLIRSGQTGQLTYRGLPAPPTGRIYQVWLKRGQQAPQPTRTLFSDRTGSVTVSGSLRGVQSVLVTDEPRPDGSRAPTRAPIIVVSLA
jgi:anti-sigma-K factor RskA